MNDKQHWFSLEKLINRFRKIQFDKKFDYYILIFYAEEKKNSQHNLVVF